MVAWLHFFAPFYAKSRILSAGCTMTKVHFSLRGKAGLSGHS